MHIVDCTKRITACTGCLNLGSLYELSQRAKEIYLTAKKKETLDKQRALIRLLFSKLILNVEKLTWEYSKIFRILLEAVSQTNCSKVKIFDGLEKETFEHRKKSYFMGQKDAFCLRRPIWLPLWDFIQTML